MTGVSILLTLVLITTPGVYIDFPAPDLWLSGRGLTPSWGDVFVEGNEYQLTAEYPFTSCNDGNYKVETMIYSSEEDRYAIEASPLVPCYDSSNSYFIRYTVTDLTVFRDGFESGDLGSWTSVQ